MIKAALFDFDGTIVDSLGNLHGVWKKTLTKHGLDLSDEEIVNNVYYASREERAERYGVDADALAASYYEIMATSYREYQAHEHVRKTFEDLQGRGVRLAVVTSARAAIVKEVLEKLELIGHFEIVLGAADVAPKKPDPEVVHLAMKRLGVMPAETVIIGDSEADVLAGKRAGIATVLFEPVHNRTYANIERAAAHGPDIRIAHFSELVPALIACALLG